MKFIIVFFLLFVAASALSLPPCPETKCLDGSVCKEGKCVRIKLPLCSMMKCMAGYVCKGGKCVRLPVPLCPMNPCPPGLGDGNNVPPNFTWEIERGYRKTRTTKFEKRGTARWAPSTYLNIYIKLYLIIRR